MSFDTEIVSTDSAMEELVSDEPILSGDDLTTQPIISDDETIFHEYSDENYTLPMDMVFNEGHIVTIACYSSIFVVSLTGNFCVLRAILFGGRKSRVNLMLLHLAVADLIVTTVMIPCEIGWSITVQWMAGDVLCRLSAFFRIFGHYLSSFVLVCISIDRYFAVVHPLSLAAANRRGKAMLILAWTLATTCSIPQLVIFHVDRHPKYTFYKQCVTFGFFPTYRHEMIYNIFCLVMLYLAPLSIIILSYGAIVITIFQKSKLSTKHMDIRRSNSGYLGRARSRTIQMTVSIVLAFVICWTPYVIISLWFCFDPSAAKLLDIKLQKALFFFACTNSCVNPIVYGIFNFCKRPPARVCTYKKRDVHKVQTWQSITQATQMTSGANSKFSPIRSRSKYCQRLNNGSSPATSADLNDLTADLLPKALNSPYRTSRGNFNKFSNAEHQVIDLQPMMTMSTLVSAEGDHLC